MTLLKFPDKDFCRRHISKHRERQGIVCKRCNFKKHYRLKAK